jgi:hypothetical protein
MCGGRKSVIGLGMLTKICPACKGTGFQEIENAKDTQNHAEQNNVKNTQNSKTEATLDQGAADSSKAKRKYVRKAAMGSGEQNLSESRAS